MPKITRATKLDKSDDDRLIALAKKKRWTISQTMRILIVDGLNDIECRELSRKTGGRSDGPPGAEVE